MYSSTITRLPRTRARLSAYCQAAATSLLDRTIDWPLPDDEITGLTTQGSPMPFDFAPPSIAAFNSCCDAAKRYADVGKLSVSAARWRIPSRFIVSTVARAVGITTAAPL